MPASRRVLLCRLGFVLLCVLPTLAVCLWIASERASAVNGPIKSDWERELTNRLGLLVEIKAVVRSDSRTTRFEGLTLRDPESGRVMAQASLVEASQLGDGWVVSAHQLTIDASQLLRWREVLEDRILRGPVSLARGESSQGIKVLPSDIILRSGDLAQTLRGVEGGLYFSADQTGIALLLTLPESAPQSKPAQLNAYRQRLASPPETVWQLETADQSIQCTYLADVLPQFARLGSDCRFAGGLTLSTSLSGVSGSLAGTFSDVDLDTLVTEHFPHQLSGRGRIDIARAVIEEGKLVELRGTLDIGGGSLSSSLLVAAVEHLGLKSANQKDDFPTTAAIPFQRLAMGFHLDGRLLRIRGLAHASTERVVVDAKGVPLLVAGTDHGVPAVNLLRVLLPDNQFLVPATRQTDALVGILPVPEFIPERVAARATHTPTRLRSSGPPDAAPVLRPPDWR